MATEAQWEVQSSSLDVNGITVYNTPPFDIYGDITVNAVEANVRETRYVQIGSYLLYSLKEYLVSAGWEVVATSYRTNSGDRTGVLGPNYFNDITNGTTTETVGGFWSGDTVPATQFTQPKDFNVFTTKDGDYWKPSEGPDKTPGVSFNEGNNPAYSVIYPGYVKLKDAADAVSPNRKGVNSQTAGGFISGRSWCLLKAPSNFEESGSTQTNSDANYHIVLDYAHSVAPSFMSAGGANFPRFNPLLDYDDNLNKGVATALNFGAFINVIVLPDYKPTQKIDGTQIAANTPWDSLTNVDGTTEYIPSEYKRPSHVNEISYTPRSTDSQLGAKFMRFIGNTVDKYFINVINTISTSSKAGTIVLGSANGQPMFNIVMNSISDALSQDIIKSNKGTNAFGGEKYFFFWSNPERISGTNTNGQANRSYNPGQFLPGLNGTIYDSNENFACMYYYSNYSPGSTGTKYSSKEISTCVPVLYSQYNGTQSGVQMLLSTTPLAKATVDYTYMEWPLPLIAIQGYTKNFTYAGRMMDIKLGPAGAPSGILAQEQGNTVYDRILFNGLWFPYNSTSALLF